MYLDSFSLKRYRSLSSIKITNLKPLNCFIGPHNSGKTNILNGLSIFWDPYVRSFEQRSRIHENNKYTKEEFSWMYFEHTESSSIEGTFNLTLDSSLKSWKDNDVIKSNFLSMANAYKLKNPESVVYNILDEFSETVDLNNVDSLSFYLSLDKDLSFYNKASIYFNNREEKIPYKSKKYDKLMIQQVIGKSHFRRFQDKPSDYEHAENVVKTLLIEGNHRLLEEITSFIFKVINQKFVFDLVHNNVIVTIEDTFTCPFNSLSSSTRRIIILGIALYTSNTNQVIILEEPELHLHPKGERALARILEDLSSQHQLFFTTHSSRFLIGNAYLVNLTKGWKTRINTIKGSKSLRKVVKLMGIRPSDSFGADIVIFCEGTTDAAVFRKFEDKLSNGSSIRQRISYVPVGGWSKIKFVLTLELLRSKFVRSKAFAILDDDIISSYPDLYKRIRKNWESVFSKNSFFSLGNTCLESLFLDYPVVLQRCFPETFTDVNKIRKIIKYERKKNIKEKDILKEFIEGDLHKIYNSRIAELLANSFKSDEIPESIRDIYLSHILIN